MKKTFIIVASILFACHTCGQLSGRAPTKKEQELFEKSRDCALVKPIALAERLRRYPFNKAIEIQLVSFKSTYDNAGGEHYQDSLPRMNDTVCYSKLLEVKILSQAQKNQLTELIFNYGFKFEYHPKGNVYFTDVVLECYNPRNAILFLDKDHKVFEFIEICFECEKTRTSSDKVGLGVYCNQKLQLIKDFFEKSEIEYGVTKGLMSDN